MKNTTAFMTALLVLAATLFAGTAQADDLGQDAQDELATPVVCTQYAEEELTKNLLGGRYLTHRECGSGAAGCDAAEQALLSEEFVREIQDSTGADCNSGTAKCEGSRWAARTWAIEGQYNEGDGEVRFWVQCGGTQAQLPRDEDGDFVCDAVERVIQCDDGPERDDGEFGCWYDVIGGNPKDVVGKCVDPLDPTVVYQALPFGSEEVYNVFENVVVL